ncbi:MAG TPA: hypothetical protein VK152_03215, partial [Paludibacter sp.]|nr:hypothetical protein [Paludibacter sp.]
MKKYSFLIVSIVLIASIFAQKTLNIFKTDLSVLNIPMSGVDSLNFSDNNANLNIYNRAENTNMQVPVSSIDSITFSDSVPGTLPVVATAVVTSVSYTTAVSGLNIVSTGGTSITEKGICWSTTPTPTVENNKIASAAASALATVNLTKLPAGDTIYIRAYATNAAGTSYGNEVDFSTLAYSLPTVQTISAAFNYSTNSANCVVKVTSNGGCTLTERGICWSTTSNPTLGDSKYANGISVGQFYAIMSGLELNKTYYVRSYATNCVGTSYGNQLVVKPLPGNVTYTLDIDPVANPEPYRLIKIAMDSACYYFNRYSTFRGNVYVYFNSGIPTAQASYHGSIGFGSNTRYQWVGTAIHEMCH